MITTNVVNNELQLVESKSIREQYIDRVDVLEQIKPIVMLSDDTHITVEMAAQHYLVGVEAIKTVIHLNKAELLSDGMKILEGEQLSCFKQLCQIQSRAKSLTIIPRRAILRIGMLLRDSEVARSIRTYLLNLEQIAPQEIKNEAQLMLQESRQNFSEIKLIMGNIYGEIKFLHKENDELKLELIQLKNNIQTNNTETNGKIIHVDFKVDGIKEDLHKFTSRINYPAETLSSRFEDAKTAFCKQFNKYGGAAQYTFIHENMQNWLDVTFPRDINVKHYVLEENKELVNIEIIEQFVHGVLTGRIIKSKNNNWYDSMGVPSNNAEWKKILRYFNNSCAYCGKSGIQLLHEHMIPQSRNGSTNLISNSVCTCPECNKDKGDQTVNEWYRGYKHFDQNRLNKILEHYNKYVPVPNI